MWSKFIRRLAVFLSVIDLCVFLVVGAVFFTDSWDLVLSRPIEAVGIIILGFIVYVMSLLFIWGLAWVAAGQDIFGE